MVIYGFNTNPWRQQKGQSRFFTEHHYALQNTTNDAGATMVKHGVVSTNVHGCTFPRLYYVSINSTSRVNTIHTQPDISVTLPHKFIDCDFNLYVLSVQLKLQINKM